MFIFSCVMKSYFDVSRASTTAAGNGSLQTDASLVDTIVRVTLELQSRVQALYIPTIERCHYVFTLWNLSNLFWYSLNLFLSYLFFLLVLWLSGLCETLEQRCSRAEILQQWHYECDWTYGKRMISSVDYNRYCQLLITVVQKYFSQEEEVICHSFHLRASNVQYVFCSFLLSWGPYH